MRSLGFGFLMLPAALAPALVAGQSLAGDPVPCKGQIISRIEVTARPPFEVVDQLFAVGSVERPAALVAEDRLHYPSPG